MAGGRTALLISWGTSGLNAQVFVRDPRTRVRSPRGPVYVPGQYVRTVADGASFRRNLAAPPIRIRAESGAIPARGYAVWVAASAVTAAAVAFGTVSQGPSRLATVQPATYEVASAETRIVRQPEQRQPATYAVASAETRVVRQAEPRSSSFADRWGSSEYVFTRADEAITASINRPVQTVRFEKPEIEESVATTVAYAPSGFSLASADSRVIELSKPAPLVTQQAAKPEFDEVENYLWEVYQREPVKKDGAGDFTWKDPAAAKRMGIGMQKYVISGMDPDFREQLYHAGRAMDADGVKWSILSAFRDDYRQTIASGIKASAKNSLHGGSRRTGGYGHGQAVDLTGVGDTSMDDVWDWIDDHGAKYGLHRPMPGYDPAHVQSRGDWHKLAKSLRQQRVTVAQKREREEAAKAKVASAAAK